MMTELLQQSFWDAVVCATDMPLWQRIYWLLQCLIDQVEGGEAG